MAKTRLGSTEPRRKKTIRRKNVVVCR